MGGGGGSLKSMSSRASPFTLEQCPATEAELSVLEENEGFRLKGSAHSNHDCQSHFCLMARMKKKKTQAS